MMVIEWLDGYMPLAVTVLRPTTAPALPSGRVSSPPRRHPHICFYTEARRMEQLPNHLSF